MGVPPMKKHVFLAGALTALAAAAAAQGGLKFAGCSISSFAYMKDMAKAYEAKTGVPIEVRGGGVPVGIKGVLSGTVDMAGSCRHLLKDEETKGAVPTVVGYDMLMIIAHPSNPVETLTLDQVRDIFAGKLTRWSEVGGADKPIVLVGRETPDAGVAVMFNEMVMKGRPLSSRRLNVLSSSEIETEIQNNPYGIAVSGISAKARKVKALKIGGVAPDRESFRSGAYPLARPLYLVSKGAPTGELKKFFDFVLSDEGQKVMAKNAIALTDGEERKAKGK